MASSTTNPHIYSSKADFVAASDWNNFFSNLFNSIFTLTASLLTVNQPSVFDDTVTINSSLTANSYNIVCNKNEVICHNDEVVTI